MENLPLFTTKNGVASLTLCEIPYSQKAYITLQETKSPRELLDECVAFCRAVGATAIYASGDDILERYPLHATVLQMERPLVGLPETDACLLPMQAKSMSIFAEIYNTKMKDIPNSAHMTRRMAEDCCRKGEGYFVYRGEELLGIGIAAGNRIDCVISQKPGAGQDVLLSLTRALSGEKVILEVALENTRAIALYKRLGFLKTQELSRWYRIF